MIQIDDKLISEDIFAESFVCNLTKCKGVCCVDGDTGAPLDKDELPILEEIFPKIKSYLRPEGVKAIEETYSYYISGDNFVISVEPAYDMTLEQAKANITADPDKKIVSTKPHSVLYTEKMLGKEMAHFESYIEIDGQLYRFYDKRVTPLTMAQVTPLCEAVETIQPGK